MIVDMRTYTMKPGQMANWVKLYHEHAWDLQQKYLGNCVGFYTVAEGALNTVVHMWRYESQADRETRRAALMQDPGWQKFLRLSSEAGYLLKQENSFLTPTSFSPQQ